MTKRITHEQYLDAWARYEAATAKRRNVREWTQAYATARRVETKYFRGLREDARKERDK